LPGSPSTLDDDTLVVLHTTVEEVLSRRERGRKEGGREGGRQREGRKGGRNAEGKWQPK